LHAQQNLVQLEQARVVLTDPAKRAAYDAANGLAGATAGLADPRQATMDLLAPPMGFGPPPSSAPPAAPRRTTKSALWECVECAADNPANTQFCFGCGAELIRECPECHAVKSLVATGFCGGCGMHFDAAQSRQRIDGERKVLASELVAVRATLDVPTETLGGEFATRYAEIASLAARARADKKPGGFVRGVVFVGSYLILLVAISLLVSFRLVPVAFLYSAVGSVIVPLLGAVLVLVLAARRWSHGFETRRMTIAGAIRDQQTRLAELIAQRRASIEGHIDMLATSLERLNHEYEALGAARGRRVDANVL
jgi:hypothetical protein